MIKNTVLMLSLFLFSFSLSANSAINKVLDTFHQAAANADQKLYFSLLDEQAVFLGTDGSERWTRKEFYDFVTPYFSRGKGWAYKPRQRNITLISSVINGEQLAFFDELLDNNNYGECRGSGVIRLTSQGWKILQYNLSIPVPNGISGEVIGKITAYHQQISSSQ
ncbi:MAG: nuclear transport factor 2 family protein [Alteromonadaceae bacterium]|jgi:hypothetical protein